MLPLLAWLALLPAWGDDWTPYCPSCFTLPRSKGHFGTKMPEIPASDRWVEVVNTSIEWGGSPPRRQPVKCMMTYRPVGRASNGAYGALNPNESPQAPRGPVAPTGPLQFNGGFVSLGPYAPKAKVNGYSIGFPENEGLRGLTGSFAVMSTYPPGVPMDDDRTRMNRDYYLACYSSEPVSAGTLQTLLFGSVALQVRSEDSVCQPGCVPGYRRAGTAASAKIEAPEPQISNGHVHYCPSCAVMPRRATVAMRQSLEIPGAGAWVEVVNTSVLWGPPPTYQPVRCFMTQLQAPNPLNPLKSASTTGVTERLGPYDSTREIDGPSHLRMPGVASLTGLQGTMYGMTSEGRGYRLACFSTRDIPIGTLQTLLFPVMDIRLRTDSTLCPSCSSTASEAPTQLEGLQQERMEEMDASKADLARLKGRAKSQRERKETGSPAPGSPEAPGGSRPAD